MSDLFSDTYVVARQRFLQACDSLGAAVVSYPCEHDSRLAIDVAKWGVSSGRRIVVTSGLHGVEGVFGSAIQLACLEFLRQRDSSGLGFVFVHALNPFGFMHSRRCNENNVDLNRNFLTNDSGYIGAPDGYRELNSLLNPQCAPRRNDAFAVHALWHLFRRGMRAMKDAIAVGQYDYPQGLFFGGDSPGWTHQIVAEHCQEWIEDAAMILHVDLHSGLGKFGGYKLLVNEATTDPRFAWYEENFGQHVESQWDEAGVAYKPRGQFGEWMQARFLERDYRFMGAEFGTYGPLRVLAALRRENQAHHYCDPSSAAFEAAKREIQECFCPRNEEWRKQVLRGGLEVFRTSIDALRT